MKTFWKIVIFFVSWRAGLFLLGSFSNFFLKYDPSFPYAVGLLDSFNVPRWIYSWANFDGVHYLTIMMHGYSGASLIEAFFPVYPYLSKTFNSILNNYLLAGLVVSNGAFLCLLYVWYQFIQKYFSRTIAIYSVVILSFFPTAFFFGATYTESLFLLLVIGAFWSLHEKKYFITALCIGLASATRVTGILLLPAVFLEIIFPELQWGITWKKCKKLIVSKFSNWREYIHPILIVSLGMLGLLSYMFYLYKSVGDPFYFFHVQSEFGGGVRQESMILYPQVIWRYIKIILTARPFDLKYITYLSEFAVGVFGLLTLLYSATKMKMSYVVFALLAFFLPTITGTFSSMPRYILICFPLFILLAIWAEKNIIFRYTWLVVSGCLLVFNTILFIQGYWVA